MDEHAPSLPQRTCIAHGCEEKTEGLVCAAHRDDGGCAVAAWDAGIPTVPISAENPKNENVSFSQDLFNGS